MTCIVGIGDGVKTWLGADSSYSQGASLSFSSPMGKLFRVGTEFIAGYAGYVKHGTLLKKELKDFTIAPDAIKGLEEYEVVGLLADKVNKVFSLNPLNSKKENRTSLLVGYKGTVYRIGVSFEVTTQENSFDSIGYTSSYALGCLHGTKDTGLSPRDRIKQSLMAAEYYNPSYTRKPFYILSL